MASIWLHKRGEKHPRKLKGYLSEQAAIALFQHIARNYKGFRQQVFDYEYLLFENGASVKSRNPAASLYVEFCSPPSGPEKGQPLHRAKGQGA